MRISSQCDSVVWVFLGSRIDQPFVEDLSNHPQGCPAQLEDATRVLDRSGSWDVQSGMN